MNAPYFLHNDNLRIKNTIDALKADGSSVSREAVEVISALWMELGLQRNVARDKSDLIPKLVKAPPRVYFFDALVQPTSDHAVCAVNELLEEHMAELEIKLADVLHAEAES